MRAALWLMAMFSVAAAAALFAGSNPGTVTVYWYPVRVDLSLNMVLLGLAAAFLAMHLALRALAAMFRIPREARRWRLLQKERAIQTQLLESLSHLTGGRFIRARKAAEAVIALEASVAGSGNALPYADRLRTLSHLLAAESAHALQDQGVREQHFQQALEHASARDAQDTRDGLQLRAAKWAFDDRDAPRALDWLGRLPQGAGRRTVALRLRFKVERRAGNTLAALEIARLLTKHRAFSEAAGASIARGLALEWLRSAHDAAQAQRAWAALEASERQMPDVAIQAAERLLVLGGDGELARQWLLPLWDAMAEHMDALTLAQRLRLVRVLESSFRNSGGAPDAAPDRAWLTRIESAQMRNPRDPVLQYLAGVVCMQLSLWGKAQQLLKQSLTLLQDPTFKRDAWKALALMAEQRQDSVAAAHAYRQALQEASSL